MVVADQAKESVRVFTATGQLVGQIGTPGSYSQINDLAVDPSSGEIWVSDSLGVHGFTSDGTPEGTARGNGVGPFQVGGIAAGPNGILYVFNGDTSTVYEYSPAGAILAMWPATNTIPAGPYWPVKLAVDGQGNVYVGVSAVVHKFSSAGSPLATFSLGSSVTSMTISGSILYAQFGSGTGAGIGTYDLSGHPQGGFADSALASAVVGPTFAIGASGIVAVTTSHTIQELGLDGTPAGSWGGLANDDFQAGDALADPAGDVYVIDSANARVIRYDAHGDPPSVFADLSAYGTPGLASFDAQGDLVVQTGSELVTLGQDGSVISAVSGYGAPEPGLTSAASYWAIDSAGNVYVDYFHGTAAVPVNHIGKYSPTGQLLQTVDVGAGWPGIGQGDPIAVDARGRIYVASTGNDIRQFSPAGTMIAVWATPSPATSLSVAANGDVYATMDARVMRFYDFLDPLPPMPPESSSPFQQEVNAITARVEATLARITQYGTRSVRTTISCAGSAKTTCAGMLLLTAKVKTRNVRTKRMTTRVTLLGLETFVVPAGRRVSETVKMNGAARQLLASRSRVDAMLTASYRAGTASSTITEKVVLHGHRSKRKAPHAPRR